MIDYLYPVNENFPGKQADGPLPGRQLGRLLAAAVVNSSFCDLLLRDAGKAISSGFQGERFFLTNEELDLVLSIRAASLVEFACQLERARVLARGTPVMKEPVPCAPTSIGLIVEVPQNTGLD